MRYEDVIEHIFKLRRFGGMKLGLERVKELSERLGNPQEKYKIIHVGGSNGKGSTVAMIASILKAAGYKVGTFTSPHLSRFTERIAVNGEEINEEKVIRLFEEIEKVSEAMEERPTFFEVTTAMALKWFADQKVDFAIIEVGLGGRLDATNIVSPLVSVITNVALEHTEVLGNNVLDIAREKGGIIKKNGVLITSALNDEVFNLFKKACNEKDSKIFRVNKDIEFVPKKRSLEYQEFDLKGLENDYADLRIPLLGEHQLRNAAAAVGAAAGTAATGVWTTVLPRVTRMRCSPASNSISVSPVCSSSPASLRTKLSSTSNFGIRRPSLFAVSRRWPPAPGGSRSARGRRSPRAPPG